MSKYLKFKTFCFEAYKSSKGLTGAEAQRLFEEFGVYAYLQDHYDVLHSQGEAYLVRDIEEYIALRMKDG